MFTDGGVPAYASSFKMFLGLVKMMLELIGEGSMTSIFQPALELITLFFCPSLHIDFIIRKSLFLLCIITRFWSNGLSQLFDPGLKSKCLN
jgi:hypothetical protein